MKHLQTFEDVSNTPQQAAPQQATPQQATPQQNQAQQVQQKIQKDLDPHKNEI